MTDGTDLIKQQKQQEKERHQREVQALAQRKNNENIRHNNTINNLYQREQNIKASKKLHNNENHYTIRQLNKKLQEILSDF